MTRETGSLTRARTFTRDRRTVRPAGRQARNLRSDAHTVLVGVDTGGTFTDLAAVIDGRIEVQKVLSTPADPSAAVLEGLTRLFGGGAPDLLTYSTTVATNALLEKKGARVALITNAGFEDLIEIGRQNRLELYALAPARPEPLIPASMRLGVDERTYFDGKIARPLSRAELSRAYRWVERSGAEAAAICLLHSYVNSDSEEKLAARLEALGLPLSVSHRILPEYREFERFSTAVVNAYVAQRMVGHLASLRERLGKTTLRVMQSNGSAISADLACLEPVRTILSGPAAGVIGSAALAREIGLDRFITFDMGGTSTDVSLYERHPKIRTLSYPGGYPVRIPTIDIHTVGAGGGSIARVDAGGSLKVGPESAGANPGPACYGRGTLPTVTDADLVGGRLRAENFLGGEMRLDSARAARAVGQVARAMKTGTLDATRGIIRVVNASMERAVRVITVERGFDPRDFALLAFGGAGPMHACELALELGIKHIVCPRNPGLLCATGALQAPLGREYSMTIREASPTYRRLLRRAAALTIRARREIAREGGLPSQIRFGLFADVRYLGESYELEVPLTAGFARGFHAAHRRMFGHSKPDAPIEVVNLRLRAAIAGYKPPPMRIARAPGKPSPVGQASTLAGARPRLVPIYERSRLGAGTRLSGPSIVTELSATSYVAPEFTLRVDDFGNLHFEQDR